MSEILISPSILSADFACLGEEIKAVEKAGCDWIHVDVMDGHFVPNLTIGAPVVKSLRHITKLPLDVHLMIENPEKYIPDFAEAGSDYITFHVEATQNPAACIQLIKKFGKKAGITLKPATPVETILPFLKEVDLVLIMTVNPGFSGQSFMADQMLKIAKVYNELKRLGSHALIEVDGGINETTGKECYQHGARVFVAGNAVFKAKDYASAISKLKGAK